MLSYTRIPSTCRCRPNRSSHRDGLNLIRVRIIASATTSVTQPGGPLKQWVSNHAGKIDVVSSPASSSGATLLVAAKDFNAGETLFSVPDAQWLSSEAIRTHPSLGKALDSLSSEPWLQAALILVAERFGGRTASSTASAAQWSAYASSLPYPLTSSPLFWSDTQRDMIRGTQLLQSVESYTAFFASKFEELQKSLFSSSPTIFPPSVFTADNFLWAVASVRSRVHTPLEEEKLALVPLADSVLHSRNPSVEWRLKSAGFLGRGQTLSVDAVRAVRKGETLTMDYGPIKLDNEILLDYGVLDPANAKAGYSLRLQLSDQDSNYDDKTDILGVNDLGGSAMFRIRTDAQPGGDMLGFLRLMQLKGGDVFLLESVFRNDVWGFMAQPVSEANERDVCRSMQEGAREAISGYPTSITEDLELLRGGSLVKGSVEETALLVRLGEKEALDSLLQFFEQREALLPTLEFYQERRLKRLGLLDDKGNTTYDGFFDKGIA